MGLWGGNSEHSFGTSALFFGPARGRADSVCRRCPSSGTPAVTALAVVEAHDAFLGPQPSLKRTPSSPKTPTRAHASLSSPAPGLADLPTAPHTLDDTAGPSTRWGPWQGGTRRSEWRWAATDSTSLPTPQDRPRGGDGPGPRR